MPGKYLFVNSHTTGKFSLETINGREHIVAKVKPIRGDITMNRLFYPDAEITSSFQQLDMLLAPSPHPLVNGVKVSAFHPLAINANNVGGMVRNPTKQGKDVFADIAIDIGVANSSGDGKEIIRRIKAGEKIGVSTGLIPGRVENVSGADDFGKPFDAIVHDIKFDHVAILLNETPAGDHAGTEMIINVGGKDYTASFSNLIDNELSNSAIHDGLQQALAAKGIKDAWVHSEGIFTDSQTFVYSTGFGRDDKSFKQGYTIDSDDKIMLLGEPTEVIKKVEFIEVKPPETVQMPEPTVTNNKGPQLDKEKLVMAIIGNANMPYNDTSFVGLMGLSEKGLIDNLAEPVSVADAMTVLQNDGYSFHNENNADDEFTEFVENRKEFKEFLNAKRDKIKSKTAHIVANSTFTDGMLANKSEAELDAIQNLIAAPAGQHQTLPFAPTINNTMSQTGPSINWEHAKIEGLA